MNTTIINVPIVRDCDNTVFDDNITVKMDLDVLLATPLNGFYGDDGNVCCKVCETPFTLKRHSCKCPSDGKNHVFLSTNSPGLDFPVLQVVEAVDDTHDERFAWVTKCIECNTYSDSSRDECICGTLPLSFLMYRSAPKPTVKPMAEPPITQQPFALALPPAHSVEQRLVSGTPVLEIPIFCGSKQVLVCTISPPKPIGEEAVPAIIRRFRPVSQTPSTSQHHINQIGVSSVNAPNCASYPSRRMTLEQALPPSYQETVRRANGAIFV